MPWFDRLERRLGRFAIPRLTSLLAMGQVLGWCAGMANPDILNKWYLIPDLVLKGEWWRLVTFAFVPPGMHALSIFCVYVFYLMGSALEASWGDLRYNLYVFISMACTVAIAFVDPRDTATVSFVGTSVFLAFAYLFPNFVIQIFFILPVRIFWLALLTWLGYAAVLIFAPPMQKLEVVASIANFLLFFGGDIWLRARSGKRRMERQVEVIKERRKAFHGCATCGRTEQDDPHLEFRFCSKCHGNYEYCLDHLRTHTHILAGGTVPAGPGSEAVPGRTDSPARAGVDERATHPTTSS